MIAGSNNLCLAPYGKPYIMSTVHANAAVAGSGLPLCGSIGEGEYLHETDPEELKFAKVCGVDLHVVTCKRCLKILSKSKSEEAHS